MYWLDIVLFFKWKMNKLFLYHLILKNIIIKHVNNLTINTFYFSQVINYGFLFYINPKMIVQNST
jgi:hypothetical protein